MIRVQLAKLDEKARQKADPKAVDAIKVAIERFSETGQIPTDVSRTIYDTRMRQAKEKLELVNTALVRTLLLSKRDDKAKEMSGLLQVNMQPYARRKLNIETSDDRKSWKNVSYSSTCRYEGGT